MLRHLSPPPEALLPLGRSRPRYLIALLASVFGVACGKRPHSRYSLEPDPGSRYGFQYVRDHSTGRWIHREWELRLDTVRELPPSPTEVVGDPQFSVQLFNPGSVQTGGLRDIRPVIDAGYRVWRGADVVGEADLAGQVAYGVTIQWRQAGAETRYDAMEVFPLPPLGETLPDQWSPWLTADSMRAGAFGWWDQVHGRQGEQPPRPEHPFEFRWRLVLAEIPGRIP